MEKNFAKEKISIIIPFHSLEKFLPKCLESIKNQTYQNFEAIMIANNVKDKSLEIAKSFAQNDKRFVLFVKDEKYNVPSIRNFGIECASGKYLTWIDGDDWVSNEYLQKLYDSIADGKCQIGVCEKIETSDRNKKFCHKNVSKSKICTAEKFEKIVLKDNRYGGYLWNKIYLTKIAKQLFFVERYPNCEDLLFVEKYLQNCKYVNIINDKLYCYYINKNGLKKSFNKLGQGIKMLSTLNEIVRVAKGQTFYKNACLKRGLHCVELLFRHRKVLKQKKYIRLKKLLKSYINIAKNCFIDKNKDDFDYYLWQKIVIKIFA